MQRHTLTLTTLGMLLVAPLACGAEEYEIGGPLAGVKLPLFPTQHGERPGYPGVDPGTCGEVRDLSIVMMKSSVHRLPPRCVFWSPTRITASGWKVAPVQPCRILM